MFGALSAFGRPTKGTIRLRTEQIWAWNVTRHHRPILSPSLHSWSCWEPHGVTLARYCYTVRHWMKVQIVTPYRVSHLQQYCVTVLGNVTSVYPPFYGFHLFLFSQARSQTCEKRLLVWSCRSVRPPGEKSTVTERIFIKFYIRVFFEILSRNVV
jgi:hypothetical protein